MKYIISIMLVVLANTSYAFSYTKEFTEAELKKSIDAIMPITKNKLFINITIKNPVIHLIEESNELSIKADIEAIAPGGLGGSGTTEITGSIRYESSKGSFYLDKPQVINFHINNISDKHQPKIKKITQSVITKVLSKKPIYKFKDNDLKHSLAKALLKSVEVENKTLFVKLSAF
jgi:hypothetical protein